MRLNTFTDYCLRVLMFAGTKGEALSTIDEIAATYGISRNHLMKVAQQLVKEGFVESVRGRGGGLRLKHLPSEIRVGDVVRATEDDFRMVECFEAGKTSCTLLPACRLRGVLGEALAAYLAVLDHHTLADLTTPSHPMRHALGLPDLKAA